MSFVLDNSVVVAFVLGEGSAYADAVMAASRGVRPKAPSLWAYEYVNTLVVGETRGRLSTQRAAQLCALGLGLDIELVPFATGDLLEEVRSLAVEAGLSGYDAAYLALALRNDLPLATLDARLDAAARNLGVRRYEPPKG